MPLPQGRKAVTVPEDRGQRGSYVVLVSQHAEGCKLGVDGGGARTGKHIGHLLEDDRQLCSKILQDFEKCPVHVKLEVVLQVGPVHWPQHRNTLNGLEGVPNVALGHLGQQMKGILLELDALLPAHESEPSDNCLRAHGPHHEDRRAAGKHGVAHPLGLGRTEDAHKTLVLAARGVLLQRLKHRIKRIMAQPMGFIKKVNAPSPGEGVVLNLLGQLPHGLDARVRGRIHLYEVHRVAPLQHGAARGALVAGVPGLADGATQEPPGENAPQSGLSGPERTGKDVRLAQSRPASKVLPKDPDGTPLPKDIVETRRAIFGVE